MILFLDTADFNTLHFAWIDPVTGKTREQRRPFNYAQSEKTAGYLEKFLQRSKNWHTELTRIVVVSGPGSFTGIRTGIALALALSLALDVEVVALTKDQLPSKIADLVRIKKSQFKKVSAGFDPSYGAEPNITIKK